MSVINTNIGSMKAANASMYANRSLGTAMERLSTGRRINSAKDDAAGLAIANQMTSQIRAQNQGIRNANDGIALAQTADGALTEVTNMLQRVRELAMQSKSGTYSLDDRSYMNAEVKELKNEIKEILTKTEFNGTKLFDGNEVKIATGAKDGDEIIITNTKIDTETAFADGSEKIGDMKVYVKAADTTDAAKATAVTASIDAAQEAIKTVDAALKLVATSRAEFGASQSRLESKVNNLTTNSTNLADARSRIEDADYSAETAALAKAQILSQASTAMLAQANQSQQNVLSLLR